MPSPALTITVEQDRIVVRRDGASEPPLSLSAGDLFGSDIAGRGREPLPAAAVVETVQGNLDAWGIEPGAEQSLLGAQVSLAVDWARCRLTPAEMHAWRAVKVNNVLAAGEWAAVGGRPEDVPALGSPRGLLFVQEGALPREIEWGALWEVCTPAFAALGKNRGQSAHTVHRVALALGVEMRTTAIQHPRMRLHRGGVVTPLPWSEETQRLALAAVHSLGASQWADLATCMEAGMPSRESLAYLAAGRDMGPIRLMVAMQ